MGTLYFDKKSKEKMVKELVKGKKFASQLQVLLQKKPIDEGGDGLVSSSAEDLVVTISRSFTQTLSVLRSCTPYDDDDDDDDHKEDQNLQLQQANSCNVNSDGHRRSEDSGESSKKRPALKDRRGCYKRKKNSQTWIIVSSTVDDGNAWRKYGQKEILNAKYPRSYYRCTHKYVQGCRATRQVQRKDDDPQKYEITYIGHHTCRDIFIFPQIVTENSENPNRSRITIAAAAAADADAASCGGSSVVSSSSRILTEVKQEYKEETITSTDNQELSDNNNNLSSLDSIVWDDFVPFQSSDEPEAVAGAGAGAGACSKMIYPPHYSSLDVYSDFENGFLFDECEFL